MKKSVLTAAALLTAVAFVQSCADDPEQHLLRVEYPVSSVLYADQTQDSVMFYTFDSWRVAPDDTPWIQVGGQDQATVDERYQLLRLYNLPVTLEPNTTGQTRRGYLRINSYEYEAYASYTQLGCLNISRPAPTADEYLSPYSNIPLKASFCLVDSAHFTLDSLSFRVANAWKLSFAEPAPAWLTLSQSAGQEGYNRVELHLTANTAATDREARLQLTSGSVTSEITVRQLAVQ